MCTMLNLFVPSKAPVGTTVVRGLRFEPGGEVQRDFARRFADENGIFLSGYGGGSCLCGFEDWDAVYAIARELLHRCALPWVAAVQFESGDRGELSERMVDPDDRELIQ